MKHRLPRPGVAAPCRPVALVHHARPRKRAALLRRAVLAAPLFLIAAIMGLRRSVKAKPAAATVKEEYAFPGEEIVVPDADDR